MKKILLTLSLLGLGLFTAHASYYVPAYPTYSYGSRASYTIGCTTYYYDTHTRASLGSERICNNPSAYVAPSYQYQYTYPTYQYDYTYSYPSYSYPYTYPSYNYQYSYPSEYYTYQYSNGVWTPGYYGGTTGYNGGCFWQDGHQACY